MSPPLSPASAASNPFCSQLKKKGKRLHLDDGPPPKYLRLPAIYGCVHLPPLFVWSHVCQCRLKTYEGTSFDDLDRWNATGLGFQFPSARRRQRRTKAMEGKRKSLPLRHSFIEPTVEPLVRACVCVCGCGCFV